MKKKVKVNSANYPGFLNPPWLAATSLEPSDPMFKDRLLALAEMAMNLSYSPYTSTKVGAAVVGIPGRIYSGGNIGNTCSTLNYCAEQVALTLGVLARDFPFKAIAVVHNSAKACPPCGRCLQLMSEFSQDMMVITRQHGKAVFWQLSYLLPVPFRRDETSLIHPSTSLKKTRRGQSKLSHRQPTCQRGAKHGRP